MPRTPTTPAQVSGHRFLLRRIEHALVRADARMLHDPQRTRARALAVGCVLVALMTAGVAVLTLVRPGMVSAGATDLVVTEGSNSLHVRIDERLHPVSNLASARLILGTPATASKVRDSALKSEHRGFPIGIIGAPGVPGTPTDPEGAGSRELSMSVCEHADSEVAGPPAVRKTLVRIGDSMEPGAGEQPDAFLASDGEDTWLISGGTRARVNARDRVLSRVLGFDRASIRPVGQALLRAIPEVPALTTLTIPNLGEPTSFPAPFDVVGTVVEVGHRRVLVLSDGAASLSPVLGDLLGTLTHVAAAREEALSQIPVADQFVVPGLPEERPRFGNDHGWLCVGRQYSEDEGGRGPAQSAKPSEGGALMFYSEQRPDGREIPYPHADGPGQAVDGFVDGRRLPGDPVAVSTHGAVHVVSSEGPGTRSSPAATFEPWVSGVIPPWTGRSWPPLGLVPSSPARRP